MEQHSLTHFPRAALVQKSASDLEDVTHHFKNSRASMQLRLNFSLTKGTWMTEALCRLRASSWVQTPLLELSMRRRCPSPRRWTCPLLLRQQPNGCGTWCIHSTQKTNDMSYNQLISDPSTCVKKRAQRSDETVRGVSWSELATVPKRKSRRSLDLSLSWNSEEDIWKVWKKSNGTKRKRRRVKRTTTTQRTNGHAWMG